MATATMEAPTIPAMPVPIPALAPPSALPEPEPYRWTIAEYRELDKTGLFNDKKTMLLGGVLYVMPMPDPPHDVSLSKADAWLRSACPAGHYVRNQQGFDIGNRTDPGPDLALVPGAIDDYASRTPRTAALIVEVAHTTVRTDTTEKAEWYATAGVPDYWVLDVLGRRLLIFREPQRLHAELAATAYRTCTAYGPDETITPLAAPEASVKVSDLLPRAPETPS